MPAINEKIVKRDDFSHVVEILFGYSVQFNSN